MSQFVCGEICRIRILFAAVHFFADAMHLLPAGLFFVYADKSVKRLCLMDLLNFSDSNISSVINKLCKNWNGTLFV